MKRKHKSFAFQSIGEDFAACDFVPIGSFYMLENEKVSLLDSTTTTEQLQLLVLKDPIRRADNLSMIKTGHSLGGYYCYNMKKFNQLDTKFPRKVMKQENLLSPIAIDKGHVYLSEIDENTWNCKLHIKGKFNISYTVEL